MTPWRVIRDEPMPLGKKPSNCQRFATEAVSPAELKPKVRTPRPITIMPISAVTLTIENQNSISPKSFTEIRLATKRTIRKTRAVTHWGMDGNQ